MVFDLRCRLRQQGVLGINQRNADFVLRYNARRLYPLVDDKLKTKQLAIEAGMAVPELYGVIETQHQIRDLPKIVGERTDFVIKPAHGSGGDGIMVITGRRKNRYRRVNGLLIDEDELEHHISNTINGQYSLGGVPDRAMIEYRVQFDPLFEAISYLGVPDIRVIVFQGYPVMSMVRLPTRQSDGKANLHQGAIGVGIDIARGETLRGVWGNEIISEHPDTLHPISGVAIPNWPLILELAAGCYEMTGLGYIGVDIVLDRDLGPLILELNARPGLNIQIANAIGIHHRLKLVERDGDPRAPVAQRIAFAVGHFETAKPEMAGEHAASSRPEVAGAQPEQPHAPG
ncbi:MAG: alpha-L-glutamate ligase-like protein [Gammaproteobacteria bacterium]|nr:alpha-L-glutamate ligase-like protein [Gammaproteobacteria bacterium]